METTLVHIFQTALALAFICFGMLVASAIPMTPFFFAHLYLRKRTELARTRIRLNYILVSYKKWALWLAAAAFTFFIFALGGFFLLFGTQVVSDLVHGTLSLGHRV